MIPNLTITIFSTGLKPPGEVSNFPKGLCEESVVKESCELLSNSRAHVTRPRLTKVIVRQFHDLNNF